MSASRRVARTRGGHDIADRLPELEVLSHIGVDMILDGELIVGAGRPADFPALAGAVASKRRDRARTSFVAFDLLAVDGQMLINRRHAERRQLLEHLAVLAADGLTVVPSYPAVDVDALLVACDELELEGVVLKPRSSLYRPGARSKEWRKVHKGAQDSVALASTPAHGTDCTDWRPRSQCISRTRAVSPDVKRESSSLPRPWQPTGWEPS